MKLFLMIAFVFSTLTTYAADPLPIRSPQTIKALNNTDAKLLLQADGSDDNGDDWQIVSEKTGNALVIQNDTSGTQATKLKITTTAAMSGYKQAQVTASTTALTSAQCGSTVISTGAAVQPLPEASTVLGCQYTFVCGTADDLDIDPADGTDSFGVINSVAGGTGAAITPSAGDEIRCTDIGSSLTIEAVGANLWAVIGVGNGAWTDVN